MKRIIIIVFALCSAVTYAQTGGCKDSIFNLEHTQFICKQVLLGDWKMDSLFYAKSTQQDSLIGSKIETIYSFYPSGDLYVKRKNEKGEKTLQTSSCTYYKGNLILSNIATETYKVLTPIKYSIESITPVRMVLVEQNDNKNDVKHILKKIK